MIIDNKSKINLGHDWIIKNLDVKASPTKKLLNQLKPIKSKEKLRKIYDRIERLLINYDTKISDYKDIRNILKDIKSLDSTFKRLENGQILSDTEFFEIKSFIFKVNDIKDIIKDFENKIDYFKNLDRLKKILNILDPDNTQINSFYIYDSYSDKLKEIRSSKKKLIKEMKEKSNTLIKKLSNDLKVKTNRKKELIVKKSNDTKKEKLINDKRVKYKNENLMNVFFKVNDDYYLKDIKEKIKDLNIKEEKEKKKVRKEISENIRKKIGGLQKSFDLILRIDLLLAKVIFAKKYKCCRPKLSDNSFSIKKGRLLNLEKKLESEDKNYQPIDIILKKGVNVITGPNMGGKTVSLKMIGFITYLAQLGFFVPAKGFNYYPLEFIMISIGDNQNMLKGLSTFAAEIQYVKKAINLNDKKGLLIIDELAQGTNPIEGYALSKSILNYFKKLDIITIISTHYDQLVDSEINHYQVNGLKYISKDLSIDRLHENMDYQLKKVKNNEIPKDAINISKYLNLDSDIIKMAEEILKGGYGFNGK
ncbi:MAG: MutS-related protein [Bacillota bacterium]